jgi:hypothetical protein
MRTLGFVGWVLATGVLAPAAVVGADVSAGSPSDLSVTIYRAPNRNGGSIRLDNLGGFALVTETRTVQLPMGESKLRFEGVADGIEAVSAIVVGLPSGVIEKNLDGQLLSPDALVAAAVGKRVVMLRTRPKTGETEQLAGDIESNADGVVFRSEQGVEALRCSGLSETFSFSPAPGLAATPTLSVRVQSAQAVTALVTLSYLARGFDWAADYSATLSHDGRSMDLGAWVTLANGNGVGFPSARTQVVAGKLNRERRQVQPIDIGSPLIAKCWPRGTTSDPSEPVYIRRASPMLAGLDSKGVTAMSVAAPAMQEVALSAQRVTQEQLGDLKLYRVPERTTVASRQSKQVRLLDRSAIPVQHIYGIDLDSGTKESPWQPAQLKLRTKNDRAHGLGLPLPSGRVSVFAADRGITVLEKEADMRDLAVDEEVEIDLGTRSDVQVSATTELRTIDTVHARLLPLLPGVLSVRQAKVDDVRRVDISNALPWPIQFEVRLRLNGDEEVIRADHPMRKKNGRPQFGLTVAANGTAMLRFQTQQTDSRMQYR